MRKPYECLNQESMEISKTKNFRSIQNTYFYLTEQYNDCQSSPIKHIEIFPQQVSNYRIKIERFSFQATTKNKTPKFHFHNKQHTLKKNIQNPQNTIIRSWPDKIVFSFGPIFSIRNCWNRFPGNRKWIFLCNKSKSPNRLFAEIFIHIVLPCLKLNKNLWFEVKIIRKYVS